MFAIRSNRTNRWFSGIDLHTGKSSSHRIIMSEVPKLFHSREIARLELLMNQLSSNIFDIIEVQLVETK